MGYFDLASLSLDMLGYMYDRLDNPKIKGGKIAAPGRLRIAIQKLNMLPFLKLWRSEPWDVLVNTHFFQLKLSAL